MNKEGILWLHKHGACFYGRDFANQYTSLNDVYEALFRAEAGSNSFQWLIWLLRKSNTKQELLECCWEAAKSMPKADEICSMSRVAEYAKQGDAASLRLADQQHFKQFKEYAAKYEVSAEEVYKFLLWDCLHRLVNDQQIVFAEAFADAHVVRCFQSDRGITRATKEYWHQVLGAAQYSSGACRAWVDPSFTATMVQAMEPLRKFKKPF